MLRVKMKHERVALCQPNEDDTVTVYVRCKECDTLDEGETMPANEVADYIKNLPCCH